MERSPIHTACRLVCLSSLLVLAACHGSQSGGSMPGDSSDHKPFDAIAANETVRITGTEPFWGGTIAGAELTYTTPENQAGARITVKRFEGRGGLSYSGALDGKLLTIAVTPGGCSDGMSDRSYPFQVMLRIGDDVRHGCGWTERQSWSGPE